MRLRPTTRGQRAAWLTVHLVGAVSWVAAVAGSLALGIGLAVWPVDKSAVFALNRMITVATWWVTIPSAIITVVTGWGLSYSWRRFGWPQWIAVKGWLAMAVLALGSIVLYTHPSSAIPLSAARTTGLLALCMALVLSVTRPDCRRPARVMSARSSGELVTAGAVGRHRKQQ